MLNVQRTVPTTKNLNDFLCTLNFDASVNPPHAVVRSTLSTVRTASLEKDKHKTNSKLPQTDTTCAVVTIAELNHPVTSSQKSDELPDLVLLQT